MMKHYRKVFFVLMPVLLVLDQVTKAMIRVQMPIVRGQPRPRHVVIDGFFNITHAKNKGAAWGIFRDLPDGTRMAFFAVVTLVAFVMILGYYRQLGPKDKLLAVSLSSIFAGAAGNFVDRLLYKEVTDFLQFYLSGGVGDWVQNKFGTSYWPSFNVADICINVGVGLFIWHVLFIEGRRKKEEDAAAPVEVAGEVPEPEPEPDPATSA